MPSSPRWSSLRAPLMVCGVGFGGFFDGIVLHEILHAVEGTVNHHLLAVHHVVDGDSTSLFDLVFLAAGLVTVAIGARLSNTRSTADGVR